MMKEIWTKRLHFAFMWITLHVMQSSKELISPISGSSSWLSQKHPRAPASSAFLRRSSTCAAWIAQRLKPCSQCSKRRYNVILFYAMLYEMLVLWVTLTVTPWHEWRRPPPEGHCQGLAFSLPPGGWRRFCGPWGQAPERDHGKHFT